MSVLVLLTGWLQQWMWLWWLLVVRIAWVGVALVNLMLIMLGLWVVLN